MRYLNENQYKLGSQGVSYERDETRSIVPTPEVEAELRIYMGKHGINSPGLLRTHNPRAFIEATVLMSPKVTLLFHFGQWHPPYGGNGNILLEPEGIFKGYGTASIRTGIKQGQVYPFRVALLALLGMNKNYTHNVRFRGRLDLPRMSKSDRIEPRFPDYGDVVAMAQNAIEDAETVQGSIQDMACQSSSPHHQSPLL